MTKNVFTIKIAGPAGAGIKSSGLVLAKILIAHGQNVRDYSEYPSLVRGGHNTYQLTFSSDEVFTIHQQIDVFFSLVPKHWQEHQSEFTKDTLVFGADADLKLPAIDTHINTVCLGIAAYLFDLDQNICQKIITQTYGDDNKNIDAFNLGYNHAKENKIKKFELVKSQKLAKQNLYDGNEAFGWGYLKAGGDFYTAYPMTPATGALHFLAAKQAEYKIKVIHPEDEIAAASLVAGAAFAGARAATGTSGGGFALMTETVSFCSAANLGVLFYLVSRPGPATGLPTWTSQGDLHFAINAGHGEFNKIVLAPGDQLESFELAADSLNLAAKFNVPAILVSDKFIAESGASLPDLSQKKIKIINSTLPLPGTPNKEYLANSYEHDEAGFAIEDAPTVNKNFINRRAQLKKIIAATPKAVFYGNQSAKKLIIGWGSTKSTILETLKMSDKKDYAFLQIKTVWPIDPNLQLLIKPFKEVVVVENNANAQLVSLLKSQFDFNPTKVLLKFDGRPFFPEELAKLL